VEAGSNTSTVTLRVVGGDEKGSLKSETVKYGRKSQGTRTWERLRWQGPAAHTKDRPVFSSARAPHGNKNVTVKQKYISGHDPGGARHQDLLTDWLTISRIVTLTWESVQLSAARGGWEGMVIQFSWGLKVWLWRKELVARARLWK
jgi:hypothetical protein